MNYLAHALDISLTTARQITAARKTMDLMQSKIIEKIIFKCHYFSQIIVIRLNGDQMQTFESKQYHSLTRL